MMRKVLLGVTLLVGFVANAQKNVAAKYAKTITEKDLKKKLTIIAGPEMEGRETATEGQRKAAAYIESNFRSLGLEPGTSAGYQMTFPVYQDSLQDVALKINDKEAVLNTDYTVRTSAIATGNWSTDKIVYGGLGRTSATNNDVDSLHLQGEWLMVLDSVARSRELLKKNIKGLLIIADDATITKPLSRKGGMHLHLDTGGTVPVIYITKKIAQQILGVANEAALYNAEKRAYATRFMLTMDVKTLLLHSTNVVGVFCGSEKPNEYVFVTAHYDHIGKQGNIINYGADDDGSGTTSVLEIAEAFAKAKAKGHAPKRSIVFMTVSGEEKGLLGSEYYTDHPLFPLDSTSVDLNIDMVGRIDPSYKGDSTNYVYVIGDDKLSSELTKITDSINANYMHMELDRRYNDANDINRFYYRSDHYNFAKNGVPVIFYFNGVHADYHRPTDTVDKINFDVMKKRVLLVYYTAWTMANRNNMMVRDIPLN